MSMSISEVLVFIATNSRVCAEPMKFIEQYRLPAKIVRLDSEEARSIAANGKYFQVTVVPTMVVIYDDGNTQVFVGAQKITQWMGMMMKRSRRDDPDHSERERGVTSYLPAGGNMYGPRPNPPRPKHFQGRGTIPDDPTGGRYNTDPEWSEEPYQEEPPPSRPSPTPPPQRRMVVEEDEPEEEPQEEPPTKKRAKSASKQKTPKRKKKPPVRFEEPEVEVEYIEEPPVSASPPPSSSRGQKTPKKPPSRMNGIYSMAKQMEKDRTASLGYKEEELPRYH